MRIIIHDEGEPRSVIKARISFHYYHFFCVYPILNIRCIKYISGRISKFSPVDELTYQKNTGKLHIITRPVCLPVRPSVCYPVINTFIHARRVVNSLTLAACLFSASALQEGQYLRCDGLGVLNQQSVGRFLHGPRRQLAGPLLQDRLQNINTI